MPRKALPCEKALLAGFARSEKHWLAVQRYRICPRGHQDPVFFSDKGLPPSSAARTCPWDVGGGGDRGYTLLKAGCAPMGRPIPGRAPPFHFNCPVALFITFLPMRTQKNKIDCPH